MVDPISPIYSELQRLQIHEIAPCANCTEIAHGQTMQIREFATAATRNISDLDLFRILEGLEGQPWRSKLLKMSCLVKLESLTILRSIWWKLLFK